MVVIINRTCDDCEDACDVVLALDTSAPRGSREIRQQVRLRGVSWTPKTPRVFYVAIVAVLRK